MATQNKFRGKRIDNGEWVYGYFFKTPLTDENSGTTPDKGWFFLTGETRYCIVSETCSVYVVDINTVGMSTGLFDKNKKEIYAGDIIKSECTVPLVVTKLKYGWGVLFDNMDIKEVEECFSDDFWESDEYEIIGNIHSNPELLTSNTTTL